MIFADFLWREMRGGQVRYRPPQWRNPNLTPIGAGFGFLVYIEDIGL